MRLLPNRCGVGCGGNGGYFSWVDSGAAVPGLCFEESIRCDCPLTSCNVSSTSPGYSVNDVGRPADGVVVVSADSGLVQANV